MDQELFAKFLKGDKSALSSLLRLHRFRLERLARDKGFDAAEIAARVSRSFEARQTELSPAPGFVHWLFLFSLKEMRELRTGESGFSGLFETPEDEFRPSPSFQQELHRYLEWMTDEKMEHYRMRFEDGLVFEEMAALLDRPKPSSPHPVAPWATWLDDWRVFLTEPKERES